MSQLILIDATQKQETIVIALKEGKIEALDSQNDSKKSKNNNIYLAKVASVVPSLQAAFVDYGDGLHGFLPFSEIHPDYYQIPVADREKLLEEMRKASDMLSSETSRAEDGSKTDSDDEVNEEAGDGDEAVVSLNASIAEGQDEKPYHKSDVYKRYKIQEVIKKDQVVLVQVEKEERGHKGASLTTYISLAGRYCVLMPNATRGGGVSRKIIDGADRSRLKKVSSEVAEEVGVAGALIIRTAGAFKTKLEIKRDCMYLQNLWNNIREHTMRSKAPTFIHEEGDVIQKTIRDLYHNEIKEILVQGKNAYGEAKKFMGALLPKHTQKLKLYEGKQSLFAKYGVDSQIAQLYSNKVELKSGGYIIINQTEALVTVDVNSGRASSERSIESTALRTNVEAAWELAHQLALRNLSGLIVIDFIDMEDKKNKRIVEKNLKDALAKDKARIQVGRISHFGLLEMSRQRIKQSFIESNTAVCPHCQGRGRIRQTNASALAVLRAIENEISAEGGEIKVFVCSELATYLLNYMRNELADMDAKLKGKVLIMVDETAGGDGFFIERVSGQNGLEKASKALSQIDGSAMDIAEIDEAETGDEDVSQQGTGKTKRKRKRNRSRKPIGENGIVATDESDAAESDDIVELAVREPASKRKIKVRHAVESVVESVDDEDSDVATTAALQQDAGTSHNSKRRKWKKGKRVPYTQTDHANVEAPQTMKEESDEVASDDEMAARRKANQSLLREIWKKIVD